MHTDRLLDQSSYNPTSHKATTINTLTRRAQLVCDTLNSLRDKSKYLEHVFQKNSYNADLNGTFTNLLKLTKRTETLHLLLQHLTIPYIKGHLRNHLMDPTALQHPSSPQTHNYVMTLADKR